MFSGRRFVARAAKLDIPVVVVNRGPTRAADFADVLVEGGCSQVLVGWAASLTGSRG